MAIKIKSEDAGEYACCSINQPCQGNKCMAWQVEMVEDSNKSNTAPPSSKFPPPPHRVNFIPTGLGYCGFVKG